MATELPTGGRPLYTAETLDASTAPRVGQISGFIPSGSEGALHAYIQFRGACPTTFSRKMSARAFALRRSSRVLSLRSRQAKKGSVHRLRMLQVHQLPVAADDAVTDHFGIPALPRHLVGVKSLAHACRAHSTMSGFETGMQALVSVTAVAIAIRRLLIHYRRHFGDSFV